VWGRDVFVGCVDLCGVWGGGGEGVGACGYGGGDGVVREEGRSVIVDEWKGDLYLWVMRISSASRV